MADKFMFTLGMINIITPPVDFNQWLKHLDTQFNEQRIKIQ